MNSAELANRTDPTLGGTPTQLERGWDYLDEEVDNTFDRHDPFSSYHEVRKAYVGEYGKGRHVGYVIRRIGGELQQDKYGNYISGIIIGETFLQ